MRRVQQQGLDEGPSWRRKNQIGMGHLQSSALAVTTITKQHIHMTLDEPAHANSRHLSSMPSEHAALCS